jgi:hypothetical protein
MANWFKIYETDLDESRLKYALNKLPEVGWVWIGILSECCKHRSDTIRWSDKLHEVFGFSDRLKVSIPKINEAVNVLVEIEYITVTGDRLKVLKWKEKQSEYNHRKERGDYQSIGESPIVSDKSVKSPLEERRGEENKGEEKEKKVASLPKPRPSLEEVKLCVAKTGLPETDAVWFWNKCEGNGWTNGGKPIKSWAHTIASWKAAGYMPSQKQKSHENNRSNPTQFVDRNVGNSNAGKAHLYKGLGSVSVPDRP